MKKTDETINSMTDDVENLSKEDAKEKIKNFIEQIDGKTKFYPDEINS